MFKFKTILLIILFALLFYTRFANLSWGLPYPMHPDERNMANAIQQLHCKLSVVGNRLSVKDCFNPKFFAYGQFPLYAGYGSVMLMKFFDGDLGTPISFEESVLSLRIISAIASIINVFVLLKLVNFLMPKNATSYMLQVTCFLFFTFSPFFIQFSRFGTTESLLMLLYTLIIYLSLKRLRKKLSDFRFILFCSCASGLAVATKFSSLVFLAVPLLALVSICADSLAGKKAGFFTYGKTLFKSLYAGTVFILFTLFFTLLFSPHNFISFNEFLGSMRYESDVAFGIYDAFYTKQFYETIPFLFQFTHIFPYALGLPVFIFFMAGFLLLPWNRYMNIMRIAWVVYFMSHAVLYAKWTRFMSPILPIMAVFAVMFLIRLYSWGLNFISWINSKLKVPAFVKTSAGKQSSKLKFKTKNLMSLMFNVSCFMLYVFMIIPGIAYLSIYQNPDVRFVASEWIDKNIPSGSYILSETANVVDLPVFPPKPYPRDPKPYTYISFNFYDLETNYFLRNQLQYHLAKADYIYLPSRRVFANHTCLKANIKYQISNIKVTNQISNMLRKRCEILEQKYPLLNDYYEKLFTGELGFEKVAEFSSFPRIEFFGLKILEFPDENAEETWTVFDHPVIRIYKKKVQGLGISG